MWCMNLSVFLFSHVYKPSSIETGTYSMLHHIGLHIFACFLWLPSPLFSVNTGSGLWEINGTTYIFFFFTPAIYFMLCYSCTSLFYWVVWLLFHSQCLWPTTPRLGWALTAELLFHVFFSFSVFISAQHCFGSACAYNSPATSHLALIFAIVLQKQRNLRWVTFVTMTSDLRGLLSVIYKSLYFIDHYDKATTTTLLTFLLYCLHSFE